LLEEEGAESVERDDVGLEALVEPTVGRLLPLNMMPRLG
jgi:hypothetical protein